MKKPSASFPFSVPLILIALFHLPLAALDKAVLEKIQGGFETRRDQAMAALTGKPLVRKAPDPPIFKGSPPTIRGTSYRLIDHSLRLFWNAEHDGEANVVLKEYLDLFDGNQAQLIDANSWPWGLDEMLRVLEYWGRSGSRKAGRVSPSVEDQAYRVFWQYVSVQSRLTHDLTLADSRLLSIESSLAHPYDIEGSENIHLMKVYTRWHLSQLLAEHPDYRDRTYDDGGTPAVHRDGWAKYQKVYFREKANRGLFIEFANEDYSIHATKGFLGMVDFAKDPELSKMARQFMDLYFASWAQEQIDGLRGGGKARVYRGIQSAMPLSLWRKLAWFYLAIGEMPDITENLFSFVTSGYRMPLVAMDLALDLEGRGTFVAKQKVMGLATNGLNSPPHYRMAPDPAVVRVTYVTPSFVFGTFVCDARAHEDWAMISDQNRYGGAIFKGDPNARLYITSHQEYRAYNTFYCLQEKGALMFQKLPDKTYSLYGGEPRIWYSDAGFSNFHEKHEWVFCEGPGCFVAAHVVGGNQAWLPVDEQYKGNTLFKGKFLVNRSPTMPVILEMVPRSMFPTLEAYMEKVLSQPLGLENGLIKYKSSYGDLLQFQYDLRKRNRINGQEVDLSPDFAWQGPYINAAWGSPKVTIAKGDLRLELDFTIK